ncbi:hypothetical protein XENOCAPTIV_007004 [Xenoophorus captivus]|uniref:Uncharacterized protein n=1 Tax=Xenoophorus captivus TaxID=1517983 RepID=A0ABV0RK73_9TELE
MQDYVSEITRLQFPIQIRKTKKTCIRRSYKNATTFNPADYAEPAQTEENYGGGSTWNNTGSVELEEGAGLEYSTGEGPNYPPKFDSGPETKIFTASSVASAPVPQENVTITKGQRIDLAVLLGKTPPSSSSETENTPMEATQPPSLPQSLVFSNSKQGGPLSQTSSSTPNEDSIRTWDPHTIYKAAAVPNCHLNFVHVGCFPAGQRAASFLLRLLIFLLNATNDILASCGAAACFRSSQNGCRSRSRSAGLPEFLGCPGFESTAFTAAQTQTAEEENFHFNKGLNLQFGALQFGSEPVLQEYESTPATTTPGNQVQNSLYTSPSRSVTSRVQHYEGVPYCSCVLNLWCMVSLGAPQAPSVGPATVSTPSGQGPVSSLAMGLNAASMGPPPTAPTSILVSSTSSTIPSPATSSTRSSVASSG